MGPEGRSISSAHSSSPEDLDQDIPSNPSEDEARPQDSLETERVKYTLEKLMDGKDKEWTAVVQRDGPLRLLDLPVDILNGIVGEVTPTNDLTSLARTCSAMHALTIPLIYSRFDIVWPDANSSQEPRSGVDALTFGLSTLVMDEDVFGEKDSENDPEEKPRACSHCGHISPPPSPQPLPRAKRRRRGNNYAKFTKKFSLGNGPAEWVKEYTLNREAGKMLGTLVAVAVARMRNLESFVWDMPSGVIREVWLALSSLSDRDDGQPCHLNRLHVRWHDNRPNVDQSRPGANSSPGSLAPLLNESSTSSVDHPNLSIAPPVRSLSVLDIDELAYLDEMSILIAKSAPKLHELRVSISASTKHRDWYASWEAPRGPLYNNAQEYPRLQTGNRMGGILGTVFGGFLSEQYVSDGEARSDLDATIGGEGFLPTQSSSKPQKARFVEDLPVSSEQTARDNVERIQRRAHAALSQSSSLYTENGFSRLPIEILELQNIPISTRVLGRTLDWRTLTELTLLDCPWSDILWKLLRQQFSPKNLGKSRNSGSFFSQSMARASHDSYPLSIRKIHCDNVSTSLLSFLKETLAPNSLEVLFLQISWPRGPTGVTVEQILKGPVRRHRASLKKIAVDSNPREINGAIIESRWQNTWLMKRTNLAFLVNWKFENLKELCISLDLKDWHYMVQRLPRLPKLRSLYIPNVPGTKVMEIAAHELASNIVDVVWLCPNMQLTYMGIGSVCFEILRGKDAINYDEDYHSAAHYGRNGSDPLADEGGDDDEDDDGDGDDVDDGGGAGPIEDEQEDTESDGSEDSASEATSEAESEEEKIQPKLREILFYDDKVAIFKARHRRL